MSERREHYQTWVRCHMCGAIIFDKPGPREFAKPEDAARCNRFCQDDES